MTINQRDFTSALLLMDASPVYQSYTVSDIFRLVIPPLELGQSKNYYENEQAHGFVSWAYLTPGARDGFLNRTRKLQPADWNAGDELWFIDFIAPYGGVRDIVRDLYKVHGHVEGFFARSLGTGIVQRTGRFNNVKT